MPPSEENRGDLWATLYGMLLHDSEECCGGGGHRMLVREHWDPSYFDSPKFKLCRVARRKADRGRST